MITICFVYFRSLTLAHLAAALYSLRRQDLSCVEKILVIDNSTADSQEQIEAVLHSLSFPIPVSLRSYKHEDPTKTHAWSTNIAVRAVETPWVFFCRADYLLSFDVVERFNAERECGFVTSHGSHLSVGLDYCELLQWRKDANVLRGHGVHYDYTDIDTGVWLARCEDFERVGGLDERLVAWGHAQTHFQWKLYQSGVRFRCIPEVLFYHMQHGGEKDLPLANQQLAGLGVTVQDMWARYAGPRMY
jgi:GT2 family glycosyltransferase